jgi:hypothetical protein
MNSAGEQNFYFGADWFSNLVRTTFDARIEPRIYCVEAADGKPLMIMAMQSPSAGAGSIFRYNIERQGSLSSITNFQSCLYGPALTSEADLAPSMMELAQFLKAESPAWTFLEINSLDCDSRFFDSAVSALRQAGFLVVTKFHFRNLYDRFDAPNYSEYLKRLNSKERKVFQNYARKSRKFEREGRVEFKLFVDENEIERAISDYEKIYAASWKDAEPHPEFYPGVFRIAARLGRLRMGVLYFNGDPISTEIGVVSGQRATMIKTAYDQRYRKYSVGAIVMMRVFEHLIEVDGIREIDLGRDDKGYKKLWLLKSRERCGIIAFNPFKRGGQRPMLAFLAEALVDLIARWTKPWVKPILQWLRRRT